MWLVFLLNYFSQFALTKSSIKIQTLFFNEEFLALFEHLWIQRTGSISVLHLSGSAWNPSPSKSFVQSCTSSLHLCPWMFLSSLWIHVGAKNITNSVCLFQLIHFLSNLWLHQHLQRQKVWECPPFCLDLLSAVGVLLAFAKFRFAAWFVIFCCFLFSRWTSTLFLRAS